MKNRFFQSFRYAASGVKRAFLNGRNLKIMTGCFGLVVVFGFLFGVSATEWIALLICSGTVLSLEIFNTAIERWTDLVESNYNKTAGAVKDLAAGAVLTASVFAAVVACVIFIPHIVAALRH